MQKNETRWPSYTIHRINSEQIKDLNVRLETINILEENTDSKIPDIAHSDFLSDLSPQARETKDKIYKWDCITLKFLHGKGNN